MKRWVGKGYWLFTPNCEINVYTRIKENIDKCNVNGMFAGYDSLFYFC